MPLVGPICSDDVHDSSAIEKGGLIVPKSPSKKLVSEAIESLDTVRRSWLRRPGVTAVDVGFKISGQKMTDDLAIRVHVTRKLPSVELAQSEVFNDTGKKNSKVGKFPVDVIEGEYGPSDAAVSEPTALDDLDEEGVAALERTGVYDPLIGGISCGNPRVTAGTIGAIVYDRIRCKPMILSNWHVLAGASAAAIGEDILQPGRVDGGTQVVASLKRMKLDSRMDAAVATLNRARSSTRDILGLGTISGIDAPSLGMNVIKSGRTTGITRGVIDGVSLSVSINYGDPGVVAFSNQIRIVPRAPWPAVDYEVSMGGDSGSVWLRESNNRAIGLHFAGETNPLPSSENAICSPIGPIASELKFSFTPVLCPAFPAPRPPTVPTFCQRYPWICSRLFRHPRFAFRFQDAEGGGQDTEMLDMIEDMLSQSGHRADSNCNCGGNSGMDENMLAELSAMLSGGR
jgi:hypothetical protein